MHLEQPDTHEIASLEANPVQTASPRFQGGRSGAKIPDTTHLPATPHNAGRFGDTQQ